MKKKLMALALAAVMCSSIYAGGVTAMANTNDRTINFDVNATNFSATTGAAQKDNKTAVYLYLTELEHNSKMQVRAIGVAGKNYANLTENGTTGNLCSYVTCAQGSQYSVHSQIKEQGYGYAKLAFRSLNKVQKERAVGKWSPDSTRTYNHAWQ